MPGKEFLGGVTNTTLHFEADGTLHVEEKMDCEPILDYTHAARNHRFDAYSPDGDFKHEAEVPAVVYVDECRKRGVAPFSKEGDVVMEWILAQPQYAKFLAAPKVRDPRVRIKGLR